VKGWPSSTLGKLITIEKGKKTHEAFATPTRTSVRYLQIEDLRPNANIKYCAPFNCPKATKADVIIAWDGANAGTVSCNLEGHIGSTLAVLRPIADETLSPVFLSRFLQVNFAYLQRTATGATIPHVSKDALNSLQIPVPPLTEQERIVKLLDKADELRKLRSQADNRTDGLISALFNDMFGDTDENPKGLPVVPFSELLAEPLRNGLSPAKNGSYPAIVFTLSAVTGEEFDGSAWKKASFARLPDRNCQATEHLFLICRGNGNRELVGRGKFPLHLTKSTVFPDTMIAAAPKLDRLFPVFLEAAWKQPRTRSQIQSNARTTNGTFKINQAAIEQIQLPVPPLPLQKEFAARVSDIRAVQAEQSASRRRLDELFQSMLHRAFNGEL